MPSMGHTKSNAVLQPLHLSLGVVSKVLVTEIYLL